MCVLESETFIVLILTSSSILCSFLQTYTFFVPYVAAWKNVRMPFSQLFTHTPTPIFLQDKIMQLLKF